MKDLYQILLKPLVTEKSTDLRESSNKYSFVVDVNATKVEIRQAAEELLDLKGKILNVSTIRVRGKPKGKLFQHQRGRRPHWKKAIITVEPGTEVQIFESI
ncbi:MAG: 50S ribosomal protein L23 [Candidatus Poribacteria bacterium]|nr:50S ribosomal protein L23 [Candidatus Poribacteria bacterium]